MIKSQPVVIKSSAQTSKELGNHHKNRQHSANSSCLNGLYAITPDMADTAQLALQVEAALQGGVRLVQYRNKSANAALQRAQALQLLALCHAYGALLIVNDDVDLCLSINADGVHLGATDGKIELARQALGDNKIIGASCYNQLDLAKAAEIAGADYVAFGACFVSSTKPAALHAPLSLITQAKSQLRLPIVAIGGITLSNAPLVIKAGAEAIAVINALFSVANISQAAQQYTSLFIKQSTNSL